MSSRVEITNPDTHITYVYESTSYWDKSIKKPRNHRKLIGKLNEKGELVPTGKRGRPRKNPVQTSEKESAESRALQEKAEIYFTKWQELDLKYKELQKENAALRKEKAEAGKKLENLLKEYYEEDKA